MKVVILCGVYEENQEESSGQEREVGFKSRRRIGAGRVGGEEKSGGQEKDAGSKRRRRTGVREGPVAGEEEEGGKATLTQYNLMIQQ